MKIAVYGRQFNDPSVFPYIRQVFDSLLAHKVDIYIHHQLNDYLQGNIDTSAYNVLECNESIQDHIDVLISLGGDGTLLDMVTVIRDSGIPVIGINFGRLGFLA